MGFPNESTHSSQETRGSEVGDKQDRLANSTPEHRIPYLGLRPFEVEDSKYFWGRKNHVEDLCGRLAGHRFIAVVGLSGAGKSSLVKAGLIPRLRAGWLPKATSDWLIAVMTPANSPVDRLSESLIKAITAFSDDADNEFSLPEAHNEPPLPEISWDHTFDRRLKGSDDGLREAIVSVHLPETTQVLLIVDQFEELFRFDQLSRFEKQSKRDESQDFVRKIINATANDAARIYVVITMRSEFMGDCAAYAGLAEAINNGIYLTPRLTIEQLQSAISVPAQLQKQIIEPELVARLVNEVTTDQDQLPVLQHALMRCWRKRQTGEKFDLALYQRIKGNKNALDSHANRVLEQIASSEDGDALRKIVEKLFKRITKIGSKEGLRKETDAGVRDAATLAEICHQIGERPEDVKKIINEFRTPARAFLRPLDPEQLTPESVIDITHESLIRKWDLLKTWVTEEEDAASAYKKLLAAEEDYAKRLEANHARVSYAGLSAIPPELLRQGEIAYFHQFLEKQHWNKNWAERYGGKYDEAIAFLDASIRDHKEKLERQEADKTRAKTREAELSEAKAKAAELEAKTTRAELQIKNAELDRSRAEEERLRLEGAFKEEAARAAEVEKALLRRELDLATAEKARDQERWRRILTSILSVGAAVLIVSVLAFLYARSQNTRAAEQETQKIEVTAAFDFTSVAASLTPMGNRVPAALSALVLEWRRGLDERVRQDVPMNEWELFAALRKQRSQAHPPSEKNQPTGSVSEVSGISVSQDGTFAVIADGNRLRSVNGGNDNVSTVPFDDADKVRLNRAGTMLVAASKPNRGMVSIQVFQVRTGGVIVAQPIYSTSIPLKNAGDGVAILTFFGGGSNPITAVTFKGQVMYMHEGDEVGSAHPSPIANLPSDQGDLVYASVDSTQNYLLLAYADGSVYVVNPAERNAGQVYPPNSFQATAAAFSNDSECVVVAFEDNSIKSKRNPASHGPGACMSNQPKGETSNDRNLISSVAMFHSYKNNQEQWRIVSGLHSHWAYAYSDGWKSLMMHQDQVKWVSFTKRGLVITASDDRKARIFDPLTGQEMLRVAHNGSVFFASTFENTLISASDDAVISWTDLPPKPLVPRFHYDLSSADGRCNLAAAAVGLYDEIAIANCKGKVLIGSQPNLRIESRTPGFWSSSPLELTIPFHETVSDHSRPIMVSSFDRKTLVWADSHPSVSTLNESWIHIRQAGNKIVPWKFRDSWEADPLLAVSARGSWVAVASSDRDNVWSISARKVTAGGFSGSQSDRLSFPVPSLYDTTKKRGLTAIAVTDDGDVVVGTTHDELIWFSARKPNGDFLCGRGAATHPDKVSPTLAASENLLPKLNGCDDRSSPTEAQRAERALSITALSFAPDGTQAFPKGLVVGRSDNRVWIQNVTESLLLQGESEIEDAQSSTFAFSTDGKWLAAIAGDTVKVFCRAGAVPIPGCVGSRASNEKTQDFKYELITFLKEPGVVQDSQFLTLDQKPTLRTIVKLNPPDGQSETDTLIPIVQFDHPLDMLSHADSICENRPDGNHELEDWINENWARKNVQPEPKHSVCNTITDEFKKRTADAAASKTVKSTK